MFNCVEKRKTNIKECLNIKWVLHSFPKGSFYKYLIYYEAAYKIYAGLRQLNI
jgi:hypothetical protein